MILPLSRISGSVVPCLLFLSYFLRLCTQKKFCSTFPALVSDDITFIYLFIYFLLFIGAYNVWVISSPSPRPLPLNLGDNFGG
jgi:hypothetical protein